LCQYLYQTTISIKTQIESILKLPSRQLLN
jgi:hypothetical protein